MDLCEKALTIIHDSLVRKEEHDICRLRMIKAESPIEQIFAAELIAQGIYPSRNQETFDKLVSAAGNGDVYPVDTFNPYPFNAYWICQKKIGQYRADFAFAFCSEEIKLEKIVVECDGHDFHEKTKQQARHDKAKDRYLLSKGWVPIHFTGSEIYNDPAKCVDEVLDYHFSKWYNLVRGEGGD